MVRGLYTAYTGMVNQQKRLDTITNNLANASTTAYKREGATARAFDEYMGVSETLSSVAVIELFTLAASESSPETASSILPCLIMEIIVSGITLLKP